MIWSVLLGDWQYSVSNPSITTPRWQSLSYGMGASRTKLLYVCICCDWHKLSTIYQIFIGYTKNVHTCSLSDRISTNTSSGRRQLTSPSSSFWLALKCLCPWPSVCNTHTHTHTHEIFIYIHSYMTLTNKTQYYTVQIHMLSYCIYYINGGKSWHSQIYILI